MKFEKKVIIGSLSSFLVAAVGFIAVFFPSLFNLEKQNVKELRLFLKDEKNFKALLDFLDKHKQKIVKLDITYCTSQNYPEARSMDENSKLYPVAEEYGTQIELSYDGLNYYGNDERYMIDSGTLTGSLDNEGLQIIKFDSSNMGQKYEWYARRTEYEDKKKFPEEVKVCGKSQDDYFFGYISGTFFVRTAEKGHAGKGYQLEAVDRREFELKNY